MKRCVLLLISAIMLISLAACAAPADEQANGKMTVAVGIVPEATFVEKVAGDRVNIVTMIPPGNSPENYQPSTAEMQALSDAVVYFEMQTPTEEANIVPKLADFNPDALVVNLRDATATEYPLLKSAEEEETGSGDGESVDPHVWLSPRRAEVIVQTIADTLSRLDPDNGDEYQQNAQSYIGELKALDQEISDAVSALANKSFVIYHPAYTYFADDYGLNMLSIEVEGKQATAADLENVIRFAKENDIKTVFYQEEFDDNQAQTVAEEIGGTVAKTAPLSPDYIQSLRDFVSALTGK